MVIGKRNGITDRGDVDCNDSLVITGRENKFPGEILPERQRYIFHPVQFRVFVHIHV